MALFGIAGALGVPAIICMGIMIMIFVYKTDILNMKNELNIFTKKEIYELFRLNINMENESLTFAFSFLI